MDGVKPRRLENCTGALSVLVIRHIQSAEKVHQVPKESDFVNILTFLPDWSYRMDPLRDYQESQD